MVAIMLIIRTMTNTHAIAVGTRVRFTHSHVMQTVTFSARVVKLDGAYAWVEMPARVRALPFPPIGGKRYGKYLIANLHPINANA